MILANLLGREYFPKEIPPCFTTLDFATKFPQIKANIAANKSPTLAAIVAHINSRTTLSAQVKTEEITRAKQIFNNRLKFSDAVSYTIPKASQSRNTLKIPNSLHLGKLAEVITTNYTAIESLLNSSNLYTTKPKIETEFGEGKRSATHDNYGYFKELCILKSYKYQVQLKTDSAKFYSTIYTHSVGWATFGSKERFKRNRDLHKNDPAKSPRGYGEDIDDTLMWCQGQL